MTDPTPQGGQRTCKCGHDAFMHWQQMFDCHTEDCSCERFEPAEPSPAPPAQPQEPLSAQDYYQRIYAGVPKNYTDWIKFAENYSDYKVASLRSAREERDRAQAALRDISAALTTAQEERRHISKLRRELHQEFMAARAKFQGALECANNAAKRRGEERDRAQEALRELDRYVRLGRGAIELGITEDGNIGIWLANEEKTLCKGDTVADAIAALKPVSDRQPEGETK